MPGETSGSGSAQLGPLQALLEGCLARDIPRLGRRLESLQQRCRRSQPIDRALPGLAADIESSRLTVEKRGQNAPCPEYPLALPVVEKRSQIMEAIDAHQVVVLCGETGSGKTTQLPKICLELGRGVRGRIGHTQPRRIAARSLAARIAEELHSSLGQQVGFKVRFQDHVQDSTYIKVMTDGILLAEIQSDPELREYDTLIIDEAHERSLNIDFMLGYLHRLLPRRPDLKLIITSATIDPVRFSEHFDQAPIVEVSGRSYPVDIRYRPLRGEDEDQKDRDSGQALLDAVDELAVDGPGDILVFLSGERPIREASELLRKHHPPHTEILPLFARLSVAQQGQVFKPHKGRRIVLATNVAETSLTVPGIRYVVDTGQARVSRYSYRTKVQRLPVEAVSQASANQRAGRCGRVAAGVCIRLYDEDDFLARPLFTEPEIQRTNLASVILKMVDLGLGAVEDFPFVEPPDSRLIRDGYKLLHELGAVDDEQGLTETGRKLARLPLDPRLARMILEAGETRCLSEILIIVSALEVIDPRERPLDQSQAADEKHALFKDAKSDFLVYVNLWNAYREQSRHLSRNKLRKWCQAHFLSYMRMREWFEVHGQLLGHIKGMGMKLNHDDADYKSIHCALLSGLLGNLAFQVESNEYLGARNLKFVMFPGSGLKKSKPKWLIANELVETGKRYLRTVAAIDPAWVEPLAQHLVKRNYSEPHWEKKQSRVVAFEKVTLYGLPLVNRRKVHFGPIDPEVSRSLFIRHALVRSEFQTQAEFARHNRHLLEELDQLESKSRRRDVLVDEDELYRFFDERLPATVHNGPKFERWWKKKSKDQPRLLHLDREKIMRHGAESVTELQFPDSLEIRGLCLPVRYHFSPGEQSDGLEVQLPLAALNQVQASDFDWLVPGLLKEKITLLIKSLPKQYRRHFVPAPDFADACRQAMKSGQGALLENLAAELERITGISVPVDAWHPESLPDHLFAHFELIDGQGLRLDSGRDLGRMQQRFGGHAQQGFAGIRDARFERNDIRQWDFGALPEFVELQSGAVRLRGYPALCAGAEAIELKLFDSQREAKESHRRGLLALFRIQAGRAIREIRRAVPELQMQVLWFSTVGSREQLQSDLETAVLQEVFLAGGDDIRDAQVFEARLDEGRKRLLETAVRIGGWSFEALQAWQELNRTLKKALSPAMIAVAKEVREQVQRLIHPGFISDTPVRYLSRLGCYIQAAAMRLEKLPGNTARDRKQGSIVQAHWDRYQQAVAAGAESEGLTEYRWLIEELRVSLFAQELGTVAKVSTERLDRLWSELS